MDPHILPNAVLLPAWSREVWFPPRNRPTLADLDPQYSAAVWCGINYRLTFAMYEAQHRFFNSNVLVWQPHFSPAVESVELFDPAHRDACSHMMYHIGLMQSILSNPYAQADYPHGDPFDPTSREYGVITGKTRLDSISSTAQLVYNLNVDAIAVISKRLPNKEITVELQWTSAAVDEFTATATEP